MGDAVQLSAWREDKQLVATNIVVSPMYVDIRICQNAECYQPGRCCTSLQHASSKFSVGKYCGCTAKHQSFTGEVPTIKLVISQVPVAGTLAVRFKIAELLTQKKGLFIHMLITFADFRYV